MNIKQAKEYIKQTAGIYLKKDELGDYVIPVVRQRPIFLLGAPGVGKTAIMEQIAGELQIALVSYSMTHHTRQSAIGLPFIKHQVFDGKEYDITEYTMSEIIATIYETMEESGIREGILFLDEINCVSETLSPSMLQFLQYKVFGRHRVPDGWVIVTAGNPPEYNKAVREFDVAVLDRMKILQVEPDYSIFKEYAIEKGLHPAIVNFLDMKREYFYRIENTVNGRSYVTARGWEDLSEILKLYEEEGLPADETLIGQYLTNETVVSEFGAYYELYNKYKRDYHVNEILGGMINETICKKAGEASFDERLSLLSMLLDQVLSDIKDNIRRLDAAANTAKILKGAEGKSGKDLLSYLEGTIEAGKKQLI
ncbi:MAG: AAA family ATPase, partial [Lachnospiraceae bacterium]|nr:AAA family ATPase [Lachnospiraceae bacterium]